MVDPGAVQRRRLRLRAEVTVRVLVMLLPMIAMVMSPWPCEATIDARLDLVDTRRMPMIRH